MQPRSLPDRIALLEQRVERLEALPAEISALRKEMHDRFDNLETRLTTQIETRFEEARRHTLVLHEDLVSRIETMGEAVNGRREPAETRSASRRARPKR